MNDHLVLCTGPPGSGRDDYLRETKEFAEQNGKTLTYHHLFDYMLESGKQKGIAVSKQTILDMYLTDPETIEDLRSDAISRILAAAGTTQGVHVVGTPYYFEWKGESLTGLTEEDVRKLDPRIIVIAIDDIIRVRERLRHDPEWKDQNYTLVEIAKWRREEIKGIYDLGHNFEPPRKPYITAVDHPPSVLYDVIFNQDKKRVYLSYPITGISKDVLGEINDFKDELSARYVVFNPLTIYDWSIVAKYKEAKDQSDSEGEGMPEELDCTINYRTGDKAYEFSTAEVEVAIKDIRRQIVDRDYRLIDRADYVVVYHPRKDISAGVMCEMVHGFSTGKPVYAMYPYEPSPFFEHYATRIDRDRDSFMKRLHSVA